MRLVPDTKTTLPDAQHAIDVGEELGVVGEELDVVAVDLDVLDQDGVRGADVRRPPGCRSTHLREQPPGCWACAGRAAATRAANARRDKKTSTNHAVERIRQSRQREESAKNITCQPAPGPARSGRSSPRRRPVGRRPHARVDGLDRIRRPRRRADRGRRASAASSRPASRAGSAPSCTRSTAAAGASAASISRTALSRIAPKTSVTPPGAASRR